MTSSIKGGEITVFATETLTFDNLAHEIAYNADATDEEVLEFVLKLDEYIADYDFTARLRDALTEALAAEDPE